ncbi:uncharacterized protein At4g13200, chloroplastic-like isoform X2 [Andrographis paniculata]|uniref:uncharacterized protein At4g13200, chloroplastic-like isoform X2 n=1 Tax=Andrographis paniculata TaxID=175694 RepID=UPI0021E6E642|nr:uncharacterized protein At4g13200, chloroplastic-like isoform X2 [Andrographis paniculata]
MSRELMAAPQLYSKLPGVGWRCNCSSNSGENEYRTALDAFFLGKALGEAITERIESSVGEFMSVIGRLQALQQKEISKFQDEILEKARRAKEQASREAMEARGLVSRSTSFSASAAEGVAETTFSVADSAVSRVENAAAAAAAASTVTNSVISSVLPKHKSTADADADNSFFGFFDKD